VDTHYIPLIFVLSPEGEEIRGCALLILTKESIIDQTGEEGFYKKFFSLFPDSYVCSIMD